MVGDIECKDECPPPLVLRTAPKCDDVGRGEGDNMAGGSGEVIDGRAGALYTMASMSVQSCEAARDRI